MRQTRLQFAAVRGAVASGVIDPLDVLTQLEPMQAAIEPYEAMARRGPGWIKVELNRPPLKGAASAQARSALTLLS
jgi:threonine dehydrogenase-like Zn-dependent dehydrogenase